MYIKHSMARALCGALALFVALQACGDDSDDNEKPPTDVTPKAGTNSGGKAGNGDGNGAGSDDGGTGNTGTGNTDTGGTSNGGTGNSNTGGGDQDVGGQAGGGNIPTPVCDLPERGTDGCFNCPEDGEQEQWLNRCATGDCVDFDDDKLVKLGGDRNATLPALPN